MGILRNALVYLGFVEDDLGEEIATYQDAPGRRVQQRSYQGDELDERSQARRYGEPEATRRVRVFEEDEAQTRRPPSREPGEYRSSARLASVHPLPPRPLAQVHIVRPESYRDAQQIGDQLRRSLPVIVNLEDSEDELARRIVAFASGLVYGLDGGLQKLARRIYLITPPQMEVSSEDRRRLVEQSGLGF